MKTLAMVGCLNLQMATVGHDHSKWSLNPMHSLSLYTSKDVVDNGDRDCDPN